ncbi:MAG: hypothetical protein J6A92_05995 [Lachnospiraceae bacterium]|nr:hypothetical protein [Lachnospiraceae bacterium]
MLSRNVGAKLPADVRCVAGFRPVFVDCDVSKTDAGSSSVEVREKRVSIHFHLDSDNVRYRI